MSRLKHKRMRVGSTADKVIDIILFKIVPILIVVLFCYAQSHFVTVKNYILSIDDIPKSFVGYKVAHVSDICNSNNKFINKIAKEKPQVIVLTGGYSDAAGNSQQTIKAVNQLMNIAPVYYIYSVDDIGNELEGTNAVNLTDSSVELSPIVKDLNQFIRDNYNESLDVMMKTEDEEIIAKLDELGKQLEETSSSTATLCGIDFYNGDYGQHNANIKALELIGPDSTKLTMMLIGNLDILDSVCKTDLDLAFFGNTFGTNRISNKYTKGCYGNNGTKLIVSGGIGKTAGTTRILNLPEVSIVTLSDGTLKNQNPLEKFIEKFLPDVGTIFDNDDGLQVYKKVFTREDE